jgi:hypothetical protein
MDGFSAAANVLTIPPQHRHAQHYFKRQAQRALSGLNYPFCILLAYAEMQRSTYSDMKKLLKG